MYKKPQKSQNGKAPP